MHLINAALPLQHIDQDAGVAGAILAVGFGVTAIGELVAQLFVGRLEAAHLTLKLGDAVG